MGSTASSGGMISDDGASVTARGVVWSTSTAPDISLPTKTSNGTGTGTFTSSLTGLTSNTQYYVRAYATNSVGTAYGDQFSFTTTSLSLGDLHGGGIVAYLFLPGDPGYVAGQDHGLIVATEDQTDGINNGNKNPGANNQNNVFWIRNGLPNLTVAPGRAIGTGRANTDAIISAMGTTRCVVVTARAYRGGGYDDWYLPSIEEAKKIYPLYTLKGQTWFFGYFPWVGGGYCSSTQYDLQNAWVAFNAPKPSAPIDPSEKIHHRNTFNIRSRAFRTF